MGTMPRETATQQSMLSIVFFNRSGLRAGWRLLIFFAILGTIGGAFYLVILPLLPPKGSGPAAEPAMPLPLVTGMGEIVVFLLVLAVTWVMSLLERRKVGEYGLPAGRFALRQMLAGYVLWGFLPISVVLLVLRGLGVFYFGPFSLHGPAILIWGLIWGFAFLAVGLFEEFFFRGYALYTLADGIGFWPAAIILALGFGGVHMSNGGETHIGIAGAVLFGLFASVTLHRTGNLWLAVGAHAGWDWGESFFYGVNDSGFQSPGHLLNPISQGPAWLSGGAVGPEGSIVSLIVWGLLTVMFLFFYRSPRRPFNLVSMAPNEPRPLR